MPIAAPPSVARLKGEPCPHCGTALVRRTSETTPYVTCPDCRDRAVMTEAAPIDRALQNASHRSHYEDPEYWGRQERIVGRFLGIFDYQYTSTVWWSAASTNAY